VVFVFYVLRPLAGFLSIGKRIGPPQAAKIIGGHFRSEISDKITNTLELQTFLDEKQGNYELVLASVEQKSRRAMTVPFSSAIDLRANLQLVPYFLVPLVIAAVVMFARPSILLEPANRIANYNVFFEKPAPFSIIIQNQRLLAFKNEDFLLEIKAEGQVVPAEALVKVGNSVFSMTSNSKGAFGYRFRNLQESLRFYLEASGFLFGPYTLEVVEKPSFSHFSVIVSNPEYTKLGTQTQNNVGDLVVAEGASIKWEFHTRGGGEASFSVEGKDLELALVKQGVFSVGLVGNESFSYTAQVKDEQYGEGDSLKYFVQIKKDAWPQISVDETQDSLLVSHLFYRGEILDDYGFSKVEMRYRIIENQQDNKDGDYKFDSFDIPINPENLNQVFFYHLDLNTIEIKPGQSIESFFVVYDNDRVNGPKQTSSRRFFHYIPTREELIAQARDTREEIKEQIQSNISSTQSSRQDIEQIRKDLLENPSLKWEQRQAFEQILEKQKELKESFEQVSELEKMNEARQSQFNQDNEHLKRQKEDLEKILEEIRNSDMDGLMEKIKEMLENLDRDMVFEMLNNLEFQLENFQNQMDRALEFYKRLELEYLLQESMSILDQAIQDQNNLIEETQAGDLSPSAMEEKQEGINQGFDNVSNLLDEFREKNQELRRPQKIDDTRGLENQIQKNLDQSLQQLKQNNPGGSLPNQKSGEQNMNQLSQRLSSMQQSMFQDQQKEDARALRQILENLLKISFAQEDLMVNIRGVNPQDPRYIGFIQGQRKIQEDMKMVEDSLVALSKRQPQIDFIVSREIQQIKLNLAGGLRNLIDRHIGPASSRQQFVMTHVNNLALLLNEALQDMQMQMEGGGGDGSCPMPSVGMQDIGEMQQRLNEILEQLQQGHQPMPGETGEPTSMSEQLARAAAEQEAIRNRLGELLKQLQDSGYDTKELQQAMGEMERTETDIVNRRINRQTINRQKQILTRLLEHEKALMEREMEERREGTTANKYDLSNPELYFEYNRKRANQQELLRRLPPNLKGYYKSLVERYLINLE
jgi:hypothetical protein